MSSDSCVCAPPPPQPPPPPSSPAKDRNSDAVALGLKLQSSGPIPKTTTMIQMNQDRPSPSSSPKQTGGPLSSTPVMACRSMRGNGTTYHDDNILASLPPPPTPTPTPAASCSTICSSENTTTALQPFDISNPSTTPFNCPGAGTEMAATMGYPFTVAQWKELERQAMIYKYMVASVPVPYELLLPIAQNLPASHSPLVNQLRYSTKQDPEPGRCKRTDGKKWRCSRDVAPNQKYCERHMHRGRPRSRKHVEPSQNPENNNNSSKKTRLENPCVQSNPCKVLGSTILPSPNETSLLLDRNNPKLVESRGLDWRMGSESEQQWRQIMQTSHSVFHHDFGEDPPLNLPSFTDFGASYDFLGSETPRKGFIDAWSNDKIKDSSVSSNGNLSPSGLKLSMAMAFDNAIEDDFGGIQMRLGGPDPELHKPTHLLSPVSWAGSTPGGPLAEVLRPSAVAQYHVGDGDSTSTSPPATTVSSPSGVLQRTMLSLSDSSVCNSPTVAASSTPAPEIVGFQWFT